MTSRNITTAEVHHQQRVKAREREREREREGERERAIGEKDKK